MKTATLSIVVLTLVSSAAQAQSSAPLGFKCKPEYFTCRDSSWSEHVGWTQRRNSWISRLNGIQNRISTCQADEIRYKNDLEQARFKYNQAVGSNRRYDGLQGLKRIKEREERNLADMKLFRDRMAELFSIVLPALRLDLHQGSNEVRALLSLERSRDLSQASEKERQAQATRVAVLEELVQSMGSGSQRKVLVDQVLALLAGDQKVREGSLGGLSGNSVELLKMAAVSNPESMSMDGLFDHIYLEAQEGVARLQYRYERDRLEIATPEQVQELRRKYESETRYSNQKSFECRGLERDQQNGPGEIQQCEKQMRIWADTFHFGCTRDYCTRHEPNNHGKDG